MSRSILLGVPSFHAVLAFAVASVILVAIPGPSVLFVIGRSLSLGRRGGLLSVLGNELGCLPLVVAVARRQSHPDRQQGLRAQPSRRPNPTPPV